MRRRDFVQFLSGVIIAVPCGAAAQAAPKTYQLATLNPRAPITAESPFGSILVRELAQRGYRLGQNLVFDARGADGKIALLPMAGDGTTVIIGSDISNSFNVVRNNDPALADALQTISGAVEKSGNKEAGLAWERFMKQAVGERDKTVLSALWDRVVKLVPDVTKLVESVAKIATLFV